MLAKLRIKTVGEDAIRSMVHEHYHKVFMCKFDRHVRMQELIPELTENDIVLDYGCGTGCVSHFFHEKYNCKVDAIEHSKEELNKAKISWGGVNWLMMSEFDFPESRYNLIFSSQVIEHVHNVGNYLSQINHMLKLGGHLVIGLPNIINPNFLMGTLFTSTKRLIRHSKEVLLKYDKVCDHINAWDPYTFVTLLSSCGFELERYIPTEGVPQPTFLYRRIPLIGRYLPAYLNKMNKGWGGNLSYTMFFRCRKVKCVSIKQDD